MRTFTPRILCLFVIAMFASGCFVRTGPSRGSRHQSVSKRCHKSQYWDGNTCRHKGRGHGARKHDGR
jgi:hypothetical protein